MATLALTPRQIKLVRHAQELVIGLCGLKLTGNLDSFEQGFYEKRRQETEGLTAVIDSVAAGQSIPVDALDRFGGPLAALELRIMRGESKVRIEEFRALKALITNAREG